MSSEEVHALNARHGTIYALVNPCMPGLFKIGRTIVRPEKRAKEISSSTGVPVPFEVHSYAKCKDHVAGELRIHNFLKNYRISKKEFFKAPETLVIEALRKEGAGGEIFVCGGVEPSPSDVPVNPSISQEESIATFLGWVKGEYEIDASGIVLSKKNQCARVRVGTFRSSEDWVTIPFGGFHHMQKALCLMMDARKKVFNQTTQGVI